MLSAYAQQQSRSKPLTRVRFGAGARCFVDGARFGGLLGVLPIGHAAVAGTRADQECDRERALLDAADVLHDLLHASVAGRPLAHCTYTHM